MNVSTIRLIVKLGAAILCVLFFLPLVQCSDYRELNVSGWEISTGTGEVFRETDLNANPLAFSLLIIPVVLFGVTQAGKAFNVVRNVSISGLSAIIVFIAWILIWVNSEIAGSRHSVSDIIEFTFSTWLILIIYIGLSGLSQHGYKLELQEKKGNQINKATEIQQENPLLRRAFLSLEDGDWAKADELLEQVLNADPENSKAYIGKLCVELQIPPQTTRYDSKEIGSSGPNLLCIRGHYANAEFPIRGSLCIGRDPRYCQIVYPANTPGISALHCEVVPTANGVLLIDKGSTYGTFLSNGQKIPANQSIMLKGHDSFYLSNRDNEFMLNP
jgi:hypothetical protein